MKESEWKEGTDKLKHDGHQLNKILDNQMKTFRHDESASLSFQTVFAKKSCDKNMLVLTSLGSGIFPKDVVVPKHSHQRTKTCRSAALVQPPLLKSDPHTGETHRTAWWTRAMKEPVEPECLECSAFNCCDNGTFPVFPSAPGGSQCFGCSYRETLRVPHLQCSLQSFTEYHAFRLADQPQRLECSAALLIQSVCKQLTYLHEHQTMQRQLNRSWRRRRRVSLRSLLKSSNKQQRRNADLALSPLLRASLQHTGGTHQTA
ncbi:hypothetical protein MHYP_G00169980 [Metynnis hypsauchen]